MRFCAPFSKEHFLFSGDLYDAPMIRKDIKEKKLPDAPGVYLFKGEKGEIFYIGKATSLRDRVKSYFSRDLIYARGPLVTQMIETAVDIEWVETDSVLEALILESKLIRQHLPPFNSKEKDDKSYHYIVVTKETYPRILLVRGKNLTEEFPASKRMYVIGPFPHGSQLKEGLRIVRKIFPFRDICVPYQETLKIGKTPRACFNRQIGLCPGVCTGEISKEEYRSRIKNLVGFFDARKIDVIKNLTKEMKQYAKAREFEKAQENKRTIFALEHIQDISLIKEDPSTSLKERKNVFRIEAYDIAHISGKEMVGVMTVVENGVVKKSDYRKFKIKTVEGANDAASLFEVLHRRFNHPEWSFPNLIVVDGNIIQRNTAERVLKEKEVGSIAVVSVVKNDRHKPERLEGEVTLLTEHKKSILLSNAEAHRFAIRFHRYIRRKNFITGGSLTKK